MMDFSSITLQKNSRKVDIVTLGCEDQLQRRNTLKGLAMQKMVQCVMKSSMEDISVKRVLKEILQNNDSYFTIEKNFKTQKQSYTKKWLFVNTEDFDDYLEIWGKELIIDKDWKICNYCGLVISASDQFSKKCRKCKKGWFQTLTKKDEQWVLLGKGAKQRMIELLKNQGYLKTVNIRKRLDFFHYTNNIFSVFEAKNKEKTGLTSQDIRKTLIYPYIISRYGFNIEKLMIIYNGKITDELQRELRQGFGEKLPFGIEIIPIKEFLLRNTTDIQTVKVTQENGKYKYDILFGKSKTIIIDLRDIN